MKENQDTINRKHEMFWNRAINRSLEMVKN